MIEKLLDKLHNREAVIGIAYKKNVDDMREFPPVELMDILQKKELLFLTHTYMSPNFRRYENIALILIRSI